MTVDLGQPTAPDSLLVSLALILFIMVILTDAFSAGME